MTRPDIEALRRLLKEATPGPWRACAWDPMERPHVHYDKPGERVCRPPDVPLTSADAHLIVAARDALPALLDRIEALEKGLRGLEEMTRPGDLMANRDVNHYVRALLASPPPGSQDKEGA